MTDTGTQAPEIQPAGRDSTESGAEVNKTKRAHRFSVEVVDSKTREVLIERWRVKSIYLNPFAVSQIELNFILLEAEPLRVLSDKICNKPVDFIVEFYDENGHAADGLEYRSYKIDIADTSYLCLDYESDQMLDLTVVAEYSLTYDSELARDK